MEQIGITERGDAALKYEWQPWVNNGCPAILITKNPRQLVNILKEKIKPEFYKNIILHCTVTGMGGSTMEPNVPKYDSFDVGSIKTTFEKMGYPLAKVVLRVDPIIPVEPALSNQIKVIDYFSKGNFDEVRISFIDNYAHLTERGLTLPWEGLHAPLEIRQAAYNQIKEKCDEYGFKLTVCGEPGFTCNGCVSEDDIKALGRNLEDYSLELNGQRQYCSCIASKKELLNNKHQCHHQCLYCYWH